jgi:hypothetical protein
MTLNSWNAGLPDTVQASEQHATSIGLWCLNGTGQVSISEGKVSFLEFYTGEKVAFLSWDQHPWVDGMDSLSGSVWVHFGPSPTMGAMITNIWVPQHTLLPHLVQAAGAAVLSWESRCSTREAQETVIRLVLEACWELHFCRKCW